jgi:phosphoribosylaminoimidazolecarboxamide formyltransferase/IMP cyclohydrolase
VGRGPRGRPGVGVRRRRGADADGRPATAEGLTSLFLEVVVAPGFDDERRERPAPKPNLRLIVDPLLRARRRARRRDPLGAIRTAGGASSSGRRTRAGRPGELAGGDAPRPDRRRAPRPRPRLAARPGVTSNAIVLVRDGRLIGFGSGQTSRVDAARQAVEKARAISGPDSLAGAACASDAFYPFPDAVEVCLEAGVTAFVQPGGSKHDAEAIAAATPAGAPRCC